MNQNLIPCVALGLLSALASDMVTAQTQVPVLNRGLDERVPLDKTPSSDNPLGDLPAYPVPPGKIRAENASIQCIHDIQVAAQSDGIIQQLFADEGGKSVKKGDVLLVIDDRVAQAEVMVAQKEWEAAEKQAKQTANVEFAKRASELSDKEFTMERELFGKGSSTKTALERKKLEAEKARYGVMVQEVDHQKEILAAEVNKEKLSAAKVRLGLHEVVAPYDGIIVRRHRDEGEWVRAGEPVFQLMHMNEMRVQAYVRVRDLSKNGLPIGSLNDAPITIQVAISDNDTIQVESKIEYVSPEIDSAKVRIWARIANQAPAGGAWQFRKGMAAVVDIDPKR